MKTLCSFALALLLVMPGAHAQDEAAGDDIIKSTQSDLLVVAAAGAGGAVLGLSTLSFYDKPSKHISNVWMGAAVGIIAGVIIVGIGHAQKTQDDMVEEASLDFDTRERGLWHERHAVAAQSIDFTAPFWAQSF